MACYVNMMQQEMVTK